MSVEKINAAKKALEYVKDGMVLGLGSGTTVRELLKILGKEIKNGLTIYGIPTSYDTELIARANKIPILKPEEVDYIDLALDGADVVEKNYLVKGGGGALLREKIIAYRAKKFVVLADEGKLKRKNFPVPLEVLPYSNSFVQRDLEKKKITSSLRRAVNKLGPIVTDNGNFILDANLNVKNAKKLELELNNIPGVIENGIFTKFSKIIVGTKKGARVL